MAAVVRPASPEVGREPEGPPTSQDVNEALGATAGRRRRWGTKGRELCGHCRPPPSLPPPPPPRGTWLLADGRNRVSLPLKREKEIEQSPAQGGRGGGGAAEHSEIASSSTHFARATKTLLRVFLSRRKRFVTKDSFWAAPLPPSLPRSLSSGTVPFPLAHESHQAMSGRPTDRSRHSSRRVAGTHFPSHL